jgi:hypothetical protein
MPVLYVPHQKKKLTKYIWRTHSLWQSCTHPCSQFEQYDLLNVVSVPTEKHTDIYIYIYTSSLFPQVVSVRLTDNAVYITRMYSRHKEDTTRHP